jgi:prophage regulatory protein
MGDLRDRLQLSTSQIFSLVARGLLPKPFLIVPGGRAKAWLESDITDWILQRKAEGEAK